MIDRYTRPEMGVVWDLDHKFGNMLQVEVAVAEVQAQLKIIPSKAANEIKKKSKISVKRILEIEKTTHHDVIAFVSQVAETVGDCGKYIHYGLTSSDVLDTAFSLQIREAAQILNTGLLELQKTMIQLIKKHRLTICAGRTHGMHAEPTTFGFKLAGYQQELVRCHHRLLNAIEQISVCKLGGAVGTFSTQSHQVEQLLAKKLNLKPEVIATQVVPRDRHAEVIWSLAMIASHLERLSVELRHLQRTEVGEVVEGFLPGQKGSSAMPHKKNPISGENISGAARLLRGYLSASMENISLWHERDISHSSVERVIFPDAFILTDYIVHRMVKLLKGLYVDENRMIENMKCSQGQLMSSHLLLAIVAKAGKSREEAYSIVQQLSHKMTPESNLQEQFQDINKTEKWLDSKEVQKIFSGETHKKQILKTLNRVNFQKDLLGLSKKSKVIFKLKRGFKK